MNKNNIKCFILSLICVVLVACGSGIKKYPFKAVAENIVDYLESVINKPELANDEDFNEDFRDKQETLLKKMQGTSIGTTIDDGIGYEVIDNKGNIICAQEGGWARDKVEVFINFELKIKDAKTAFENNDLMVVFYDDQDNAAYVESLGAAIEENAKVDVDTIAVVDTMAVADSGIDAEQFSLPFKDGDIVTKGVRVYFKVFSAKTFVNITKAVIKKYEYSLYREINNSYEEKIEEERYRIKNAIGGSD